jgi:hypothetical protein
MDEKMMRVGFEPTNRGLVARNHSQPKTSAFDHFATSPKASVGVKLCTYLLCYLRRTPAGILHLFYEQLGLGAVDMVFGMDFHGSTSTGHGFSRSHNSSFRMYMYLPFQHADRCC